MRVAILNSKVSLHGTFSLLDHHAPKGSHTLQLLELNFEVHNILGFHLELH